MDECQRGEVPPRGRWVSRRLWLRLGATFLTVALLALAAVAGGQWQARRATREAEWAARSAALAVLAGALDNVTADATKINGSGWRDLGSSQAPGSAAMGARVLEDLTQEKEERDVWATLEGACLDLAGLNQLLFQRVRVFGPGSEAVRPDGEFYQSLAAAVVTPLAGLVRTWSEEPVEAAGTPPGGLAGLVERLRAEVTTYEAHGLAPEDVPPTVDEARAQVAAWALAEKHADPGNPPGAIGRPEAVFKLRDGLHFWRVPLTGGSTPRVDVDMFSGQAIGFVLAPVGPPAKLPAPGEGVSQEMARVIAFGYCDEAGYDGDKTTSLEAFNSGDAGLLVNDPAAFEPPVGSWVFVVHRQAGGLVVEADEIRVAVDAQTGEVTAFQALRWDTAFDPSEKLDQVEASRVAAARDPLAAQDAPVAKVILSQRVPGQAVAVWDFGSVLAVGWSSGLIERYDPDWLERR